MKVLITLIRIRNGRAETIVKRFEDAQEAANWFIQDSYFDESYTKVALWERFDS